VTCVTVGARFAMPTCCEVSTVDVRVDRPLRGDDAVGEVLFASTTTGVRQHIVVLHSSRGAHAFAHFVGRMSTKKKNG